MSTILKLLIALSSVHLSISITQTIQCPVGYERFHDSCYMLSEEKVNYTESIDRCIAENGELASVSSTAVDKFLVHILISVLGNVWIGTTDVVKEDYWREQNLTGDVSEPPLRYVTGAVADGFNASNCLAYRTRRKAWFDVRCSRRLRSICEKDGATAADCPSDFPYHNNGSCYIFVETTLNWEDAEANCNSVGAYLAEVLTEDENGFLVTQLKYSNDNIWIGASDITSEGVWLWVKSGFAVEGYVNWGNGQPDNRFYNEHCLAYRTRAQLWVDISCSMTRKYICEVALPTLDYTCYPNGTIVAENDESTKFQGAFASGGCSVCSTSFNANYSLVTITGCSLETDILLIFKNANQLSDIIAGQDIAAYYLYCNEIGLRRNVTQAFTPTLSAAVVSSITPLMGLQSAFRKGTGFLAPIIRSAKLTSQLYWTIDIPVQYYSLPTMCTVYSGQAVSDSALNKVVIIDGCSQDPDLISDFGNLRQFRYITRTTALFHVFKFYNSDYITIECNVLFCQEAAECAPDCSERRRRDTSKDIGEEHFTTTTLKIQDASSILLYSSAPTLVSGVSLLWLLLRLFI